MEKNKIPALEIKDGLFEAGKIHTTIANNMQTLAFYIQTPELWQSLCETDPEAATTLKEMVAIIALDWQSKLKDQGFAEETEIELPNS